MTLCAGDIPACAATFLALPMLSAALIFAVMRLLRGPATPDRVVALDLTALLTVGIMACDAVMTDEPAILSAALVVGLLGFLGTVAFARYLERKVER